MLFHITKFTERTLYKTNYFYPNINNILCMCIKPLTTWKFQLSFTVGKSSNILILNY